MTTTASTSPDFADQVCGCVLGDERVKLLMQQWGQKAKRALDGRGLTCLVLGDDLALEHTAFGRQQVLGVEVWDASNEFAWDLRLELVSSTDPNTLGFVEVMSRFGVGAFDPDSELDTWTAKSLFSVPPCTPSQGHTPEVLAGQALTKLVQWHHREADEVFAELALRIDEGLRP